MIAAEATDDLATETPTEETAAEAPVDAATLDHALKQFPQFDFDAGDVDAAELDPPEAFDLSFDDLGIDPDAAIESTEPSAGAEALEPAQQQPGQLEVINARHPIEDFPSDTLATYRRKRELMAMLFAQRDRVLDAEQRLEESKDDVKARKKTLEARQTHLNELIEELAELSGDEYADVLSSMAIAPHRATRAQPVGDATTTAARSGGDGEGEGQGETGDVDAIASADGDPAAPLPLPKPAAPLPGQQDLFDGGADTANDSDERPPDHWGEATIDVLGFTEKQTDLLKEAEIETVEDLETFICRGHFVPGEIKGIGQAAIDKMTDKLVKFRKEHPVP